jgi:hypothetical protein
VQDFARREFELMLLRRMADFQPDLVEAACDELGVSHGEYMAAHNRWQSMLRSKRSPRGLALYQAVLGPPDTERPTRYGDATLTMCTWQLPGLWPDLRWETTVGVGGAVLHEWLVRSPDYPVPELPAPERLAPWSCVVGDVATRFPQARPADPQTPSQWLVFVTDEQNREWRLTFVHGLVQTTVPSR